MAGRIRQHDVDEVKARTNIADIVGDHVSLKSAGVGSLKGLCPFHDERSPSFHVRPQLGFYHCFGCGESGDVYSFMQKMDHVSFAEAVERLAGRLGYELHYEDGGQAVDRGNRARLLAANDAAAAFFEARLSAPDAEPGRRFLGERGFDAASARQFGVGFAPKSWDELTRHLRTQGFSESEIVEAGLVSRGDRGIYDRFRGRLIWPIRDVTGQTVGFGARRLLEDDRGPKYLNTPETPVYHKANVLYGLDVAKRDMARRRQVVIVEGYTDVMACHLAGVTTAVATCGTSFGVEHIRVLRRVLGDHTGLGEVIFTFDPDEAGRRAAMRAFAEEQRFAAQTFVAVAPDGLDPCDLRLARGDEAVRSLIERRTPMFEFVLRHTVAEYDRDTVEGRVAALRAAAPIVAQIRDSSLRPGYTRELARMLGMELGEVQRAVGDAGSGGAPPARARGMEPERGTTDVRAEPRYTLADLPRDPATRLERDALQVLLQHPTAVDRTLVQRAVTSRFGNEALAVVRDGIAANLDVLGGSDGVARILADIPAPFADLVRQLVVAPVPERSERELSAYARGVVGSLIDRELLRQKADLLGRLQRTDPSDRDAYTALQRELMHLETDRRALREE